MQGASSEIVVKRDWHGGGAFRSPSLHHHVATTLADALKSMLLEDATYGFAR